ncbi:MAG TPA: hypothetical protein VLS90_08225 [Thermodesulfobacteriota bacterium]|nr:hypothetical protein [Thermodesulfobacteriota bacterium]
MHALQSFAIVMVCTLIWLTVVMSFVLGEEMTACREDCRPLNTFHDGSFYGRYERVKSQGEDESIYGGGSNLKRRIGEGQETLPGFDI